MPATYGFNLSSVSSIDTPITCRPFLAYLFWNSINQGISILQGPHHVAQKSSRITLPLNAERLTSWFERSLSVKFRLAAFAFAGQDTVSGAAADARNGGHGRSTPSVNSASARALTAATAHLIAFVIRVPLCALRRWTLFFAFCPLPLLSALFALSHRRLNG